MLIFEMYQHLLLALLYWRLTYAVKNSKIVDNCIGDCIQENELGLLEIHQINFCMKNCSNEQGISWPFSETTTCDVTADNPESEHNICSVQDIQLSSYLRKLSLVTREYLFVHWKPCSVALEHLEGYQIVLHKTGIPGSYTYCTQIALSRKLITNDTQSIFTIFLYDYILDYNTEYVISIYGLPMKEHNLMSEFLFDSKSCSELNGFGTCDCGLSEYNPLPQPIVTVSGYRVTVTIKPLIKCFYVKRYELVILYGTGNIVTKKIFPLPLENLVQSFYPRRDILYEDLAVNYRAIQSGTIYSDSSATNIEVVEWTPTKPEITIASNGLDVTWSCAPKVYNVSKYQIKLIFNGSITVVQTVNARCANGNVMATMMKFLSSGLYSTQVREWRDPNDKLQAEWSSASNIVNFVLKTPQKHVISNNHILVVALAVTIFIIIILIVATIICCRHKHLCLKVQLLPDSVRRVIGLTPDQCHVCKTVWVVWQAHSQVHSTAAEVHSENIRHLASFLANHCGLAVILDQYEVTRAPSLSVWLKEKQKVADTVLFVCPHQPISQSDYPFNQLIGNLLSVYNLYESALLFENMSVKFASIVLPYSCTTFYSEAKMLLHKIPSFKLMDDIDSLYFFIQNRGKAGPYGRYVLQHVNKHDYFKTDEGAKLKAGFQEMLQILSEGQPSNSNSADESMPICDNLLERTLDVCEIVDQDTVLQFSDDFEPQPPPPIQPEEDTDHTLYVINTSDLLSQQPIESECIEAVTFDSNCPLLLPSPFATMSL